VKKAPNITSKQLSAHGLLTLLLTGSIVVLATPQERPAAFEVESIRVNKTGDPSSNLVPRRGGFSAVNVTLMQLARFAFQIQEFQIAGQPAWFNAERYDIEARSRPEIESERAEVWQPMVQNLLARRFGLAYHIEQREQSVYELLVVRNGHKLKPAQNTDCVFPTPSRCGFRARSGEIIGDQVSMEAFATRLSRSIGRTVVNKTNLDGVFDLVVQWTPESDLGLRNDLAALPAGGPSIFTALQEQLGLRLEAAKGPIEVFVIDRVERPSEN
jgi:uncharacterized protein (TIGR03435 family)